MKKFKKYLSIFLSLILMLQIIAFPSACAEVFETFRNKQGDDSLRLFKDRVRRIWGNVTMPCKTTCLAFIIH